MGILEAAKDVPSASSAAEALPVLAASCARGAVEEQSVQVSERHQSLKDYAGWRIATLRDVHSALRMNLCPPQRQFWLEACVLRTASGERRAHTGKQ